MDAVLPTPEIFPFQAFGATHARFSIPQILSTVVKDLVEATVFVRAPDRIHELLVTEADALERADVVRGRSRRRSAAARSPRTAMRGAINLGGRVDRSAG